MTKSTVLSIIILTFFKSAKNENVVYRNGYKPHKPRHGVCKRNA